jgi:sugar/nucleoside kinase (ribokinase family)
MSTLKINPQSPYRNLIGVGGLGTGMLFALEGDHTLGRNESRAGHLLDAHDYCKLHIVIHYVAKLLGAHPSGTPFHVLPVGRVGDDAAGQMVLSDMRNVGIDTTLVYRTKDKPTLLSVCFQYPDGTGGNITTNNSAAAALTESDLEQAAEFLEANGPNTISLAVPEVSLGTRQQFLKIASDAKSFRVASFVSAEIALARDGGMLEMVDLLALNESEAGILAGCPYSAETPEPFLEAFQFLTSDSKRNLKIVVSVGKHGAYGFANGQTAFCPAPAVPVASTAGAGDALLGGVISALAAGVPFIRTDKYWVQDSTRTSLATALEFGVVLASYTVSSPHTIHPCVSLDNLSKFAREVGVDWTTVTEAMLR